MWVRQNEGDLTSVQPDKANWVGHHGKVEVFLHIERKENDFDFALVSKVTLRTVRHFFIAQSEKKTPKPS
jgi:hypothetical protein